MRLSVVIPTLNSATFIKECLRTVVNFTSSRFEQTELVIVDNASHDNTREICRQFETPENIHIRLHRFNKNYGQKFAIIKGLDIASFELAISFDDDLQFSIEYLSLALDKFKNDPKLIMVNGRVISHKRKGKKQWLSIPLRIVFPRYYEKSYFSPYKIYRLNEMKKLGLSNPFLFWKFSTRKMAVIDIEKSSGLRDYTNYSDQRNLVLVSTILVKTIEKISLILFLTLCFFQFFKIAIILGLSLFILSKMLLMLELFYTARIMNEQNAGEEMA